MPDCKQPLRFVLPLVGLLALPGTVLAGDDIPVAELPDAVVGALKARFPDAQLLSAEKETDNGKVVYEVKLDSPAAGGRHEVDVSADGSILDIDPED